MKIGNLPKLTLLNTFAIFHHFIIHLLIFTSSKHTKSVTYAISYLRFSYNYQGRNLSHIIVGTRNLLLCSLRVFFFFPILSSDLYSFFLFRQHQWEYKSLLQVLLHQDLEQCIYLWVACCCKLSESFNLHLGGGGLGNERENRNYHVK